ncbi:helix-turn-helix transcriptional regulator [Brevibacterium sp. CSND-B09]|uniref:helix-turn-helix transcriptional regulator n=1 Tax=Brevibacterium sp. CSND-B09 TaxID=3462571 RepID=UPI00406A5EAA
MRQINGRRVLSTAEASEYFGGTPSVGTLRYWRHIGEGPKSFRLGRKLVMYFEDDLETWLMDQYEESVTA